MNVLPHKSSAPQQPSEFYYFSKGDITANAQKSTNKPGFVLNV